MPSLYDCGIALIEYDYMNNPKRIQFTNGNVTKYIYSATGEKLRTIYQTAVPNITVAMGSKHELTDAEVLYKDSVDYYHGGKLTVKNGRLDKCYFDGGYAQASPAEVALNCKPSFFRFEEEGEIIIEDDNGNVIESSTVPSSNSQPSAPRPSTPLLYDPIYKSDEDVFAFYYYTADHLGNIREVINEDGAVEQITNYYPFGTPFAAEAGNTNPDLQNHKYNGKEFDTMHGLNTYDYGARQYNSLFGRWDRMDPLCEKYYSVSPYAYCANNPVMYVDPDGKEVQIVGPLANMAMQQLQERVGNKVELSLSDNSYLCYNIVGDGRLNKNARTLIGMIDNCEITINMTTTDNKTTSTGNLFIGGAFMGNNVELNANGEVVNVTACQEVNPQVLDRADTYSSKGTFVMHELTEAYEGAKISMQQKVSSPKANNANSVYKQAHNNATFQPPVYQRMLDASGNVIDDPKQANRIEWYVKPNNTSKNECIIQTFP